VVGLLRGTGNIEKRNTEPNTRYHDVAAVYTTKRGAATEICENELHAACLLRVTTPFNDRVGTAQQTSDLIVTLQVVNSSPSNLFAAGSMSSM
jgi:hypothetical protein